MSHEHPTILARATRVTTVRGETTIVAEGMKTLTGGDIHEHFMFTPLEFRPATYVYDGDTPTDVAFGDVNDALAAGGYEAIKPGDELVLLVKGHDVKAWDIEPELREARLATA